MGGTFILLLLSIPYIAYRIDKIDDIINRLNKRR